MLSFMGAKEGSWLYHHAETRGQDLESYSNFGIYIRALYWTVDTASTRGNGDFLGELLSLPSLTTRAYLRVSIARALPACTCHGARGCV